METGAIIGIVAVVFALGMGGVLAYFFMMSRKQPSLRTLMRSGGLSDYGSASEVRERLKNDVDGKEFQKFKTATKKSVKHKVPVTLEEKFFHAGMFSAAERRSFQRIRAICPLVTCVVLGFAFTGASMKLAVVGAVIGLLWGFQLPMTILDRRIKRRGEEIMFYLPLVIEQIVIGVSSSLDVGPCLQRVVDMADERDSHNPVTELFRQAQLLMKSGLSMEESLNEVGNLSGHTELKHSFMALAQVAKHGGEITRQLQELADAVANQREAKIEGKIKKLELEATGPVAMVFAGFLAILLTGMVAQLSSAFR